METKTKEKCKKIQKSEMKYNIKFRPNKYDLLSKDYGIGYCLNGYEFYFDKDDYELIKNIKWSNSKGYIVASSNPSIKLHNLIMNITPTRQIMVDHINRIKNDNRKENLRIVSNTQNTINNGTYSKTLERSGCKGVTWDKTKNKWQATIRIDKKLVKLGIFKKDNLESAIICRLKAEKEYFGEYSPQQDLFIKYNI